MRIQMRATTMVNRMIIVEILKREGTKVRICKDHVPIAFLKKGDVKKAFNAEFMGPCLDMMSSEQVDRWMHHAAVGSLAYFVTRERFVFEHRSKRLGHFLDPCGLGVGSAKERRKRAQRNAS